MMKSFQTICSLSLLGLSLVSYASQTSEQQQAQVLCNQYVRQAETVNNQPAEAMIMCKASLQSPKEWQCMLNKQKQGWNFNDASTTCFQDAPFLPEFKKNQGNKFDNIKPSEACKAAVDAFENYGLVGKLPIDFCVAPERTSVMWGCVASFAKGDNSFVYAMKQCFPNKSKFND